MEAGDRRLVHTPFVPAGYWSPCAPLVWNPVKAPDIRFSSCQFRKQHPHHEKAIHTKINETSTVELQKPRRKRYELDHCILTTSCSVLYPGSITDEQGGSDADVEARIRKTRTAFLQLKNIWNSKHLQTNIKVRIFNTNVKAVLLYGAENWRTTTTIIKKVQVFINSCIRKILDIYWLDIIGNSLL
ncbi:unnamed protein product [Schistosoma margrebowiei]|uniref:Uncharacterized protein n=1 Tax=Schistosoma margrebowiei TaxID=48269 RepID=A0A183LGU6_9TREM|nr:unnamed protein product [Schistosoma margrebowiei]